MQTIADRVKPIPPLVARDITSRYSWLSLALAEPNLGAPIGTGFYVLTAQEDGERGWSLYVTPTDLLANSITARDLLAFKFRAGENTYLLPGIDNSFILGDNLIGGYSNTTFLVNLSVTEKIYSNKGGSVLLDTLTAYELQAGRYNKKVAAANDTSFIIGNYLTVGEPDYLYVNSLSANVSIRAPRLFVDSGGSVILDSLAVTTLSALSTIQQFTETRTVILSLTSLSAEDIYARGNITAGKTMSAVKGEFSELSSTNFFAGTNVKYGPLASNSFVLGSNITASLPNFTYVENLCAVKDVYVVGSLNASSGNFSIDTIKTRELSATYFTAGSSNRYRGAALGDYANSFILGRSITAGYRDTTFVNNLCAVDKITSTTLSGQMAHFEGLSSRGLIVGTNNRVLTGVQNAYVIGNNIVAGISNTLYTNTLSVLGNLTVTGNISAGSLAGSEGLANAIEWVKDNGDLSKQVNSLVASQSGYWMEPVKRFEYAYGVGDTPDASYSGMAPASATTTNAIFNNIWTITKITYTIVGAVSAVDKSYNASWFGRTTVPYTRIWP